jgi:hypothetical protein
MGTEGWKGVAIGAVSRVKSKEAGNRHDPGKNLPRFVGDYLRYGAKEGERNKKLFVAACAYRDAGKSIEDASKTLGARAEVDGLDGDEIGTTICSPYRRTSEGSKHHLQPDRSTQKQSVIVTRALSGAGDLPLPEPISNGSEVFLRACFGTDEFVQIALWGEKADGRIIPCSAGSAHPCGTWIEYFLAEREPEDEELAKEAVYVRINPVDENGDGTDKSVTSYRHVLVEIDDANLSKEKQYNLFIESGLPISAITDSANKSIHALVRVDAPDRDEYDRRREIIYQMFKDYRLDSANKNPSRFSRLPGGLRPINGEKREQHLLAVHAGAASWDEWETANVVVEESKAKFDELLERTFWLSEKDRYYWRAANENWLPLGKFDLKSHAGAAGLFEDAENKNDCTIIFGPVHS